MLFKRVIVSCLGIGEAWAPCSFLVHATRCVCVCVCF